MPAAVSLRTAFSADKLWQLAVATKVANQSRHLLSLAAILDGMSRIEAARIGGMDRQTLRDWVHRFNERGPDGLKDNWSKGNPPRLSSDQQAELTRLVETGPDRAVHGVVRWRRIDLQRLIAECFGVVRHPGKVEPAERSLLLAYRMPLGGPVSDEERRALNSALLVTFGAPTRPSWRPVGRRGSISSPASRQSGSMPFFRPLPMRTPSSGTISSHAQSIWMQPARRLPPNSPARS